MKIGILTALNDDKSNAELQQRIIKQIDQRNVSEPRVKIAITSKLSSETDEICSAISKKTITILVIEIDDPDTRWKTFLEAREAKIPVVCLCHGKHVFTAVEKLSAIPVQARNRNTALTRIAFEVVTILQTLEDSRLNQ